MRVVYGEIAHSRSLPTGAAVRLKLEEHGVAIADASEMQSFLRNLVPADQNLWNILARAIELDDRAVKVCSFSALSFADNG